MRSIDARVRTLTASLLLSVLLFSGVVMAQADEAPKEDNQLILILCLGPLLLICLIFVVFGILWTVLGLSLIHI